MLDGSDDPLGIVAIAALLVCVWRERHGLLRTPHLGWLSVALLFTLAATLLATQVAPLLRGVIAVLALLAACVAVRQPRQPLLAWLGLALLSLPIISSLQFFAGYPLRLVTAEASALILQSAGLEVLRQGSALLVAGRLIIVDAPCSGIQMGWMAYFTACASAAFLRLPDRVFLRRIPVIGLIVLVGNIARNSVLVLKEAVLLHWPSWTHEAVGLLTFAAVCGLVLWQVMRGNTLARVDSTPATAPTHPRYAAAFALSFSALALFPLITPQRDIITPSQQQAFEWPLLLDQRPLRPLALSPVEASFAANFPGAIARFSDGERLITLRHVLRPTRKLHPAADCYRGLGYQISAAKLETLPGAKIGGSLQRCFIASRDGIRLRVCEYIQGPSGSTHTDTSSWYWDAIRGHSTAPWLAVTIARPL